MIKKAALVIFISFFGILLFGCVEGNNQSQDHTLFDVQAWEEFVVANIQEKTINFSILESGGAQSNMSRESINTFIYDRSGNIITRAFFAHVIEHSWHILERCGDGDISFNIMSAQSRMLA